MRFRPDDPDSGNDYFDGPDLPDPEPEVKKEKEEERPRYTPDDPRYWDDDDSEWGPLPSPGRENLRRWILGGVLLLCAILLTALWIRYLTPVETEASRAGYIEVIGKEGQVLKSFEGVMLPYRELMDTARVYDEDFLFSTRNDTLAARLKLAELHGTPVRLGYVRYRLALPWKGKTTVIVTSVDSVDPTTLLPPDRRPEPGILPSNPQKEQ